MKEKLKELIINSINAWDEEGIYALSLYLENVDDDSLNPTVQFGYNTEKEFQESLRMTDAVEARWNYAFWLQNCEFVFGLEDTAADMEQWMDEHGFSALELDEHYEDDEGLRNVFINEIIELVQELHAEKILTQKYGCELPIIIHELEYYDEIAEYNKKANGEYLPNEFVDFCLGL